MEDVPIGKDDFKIIRDNGYYFVDKTRFIGDVLSMPGTEVFLFTRPRRFGKSINMSMLDAFLNVQYEGNHWFDGLWISDHPEYRQMMNGHPVIFISMKSLMSYDYNLFLEDLADLIRDSCIKHEYLLNSDISPNLKDEFSLLYNKKASESELKNSLKNLSTMLRQYHGKRVIILIDEYDNPIQNSYGMDSQAKIIAFLRGFFSAALKSNENLQFAVVTGVMQIAKESIFSGLNNLNVNNIFSNKFEDSFGFTEAEVRKMLQYYGHEEKMTEIREWYDGYRFGDVDIYNPWSVLKYIQTGFKPGKYWSGTSGNDIIETLLNIPDDNMWDNLEKLSRKDTLVKKLDPAIPYANIANDLNSIYSIMAMSGYLNAKVTEDGGYELSIPNREMYDVYMETIYNHIGNSDMAVDIRGLFRSMQTGDTKLMDEKIHDLMKETISSKILNNEHVYQAYLIGMMMGFCGNYEIYGDRLESGDGFADIIFRKRRGPGVNVIIELKKSTSEKELEKDAHLAMDQIFEKDYMHGLEGRTILYGVSFFSKKPFIITQEA